MVALTFPPRDVVLVAINYRLGPFGFYSLGDEKVLVLDSKTKLEKVVHRFRAMQGSETRLWL